MLVVVPAVWYGAMEITGGNRVIAGGLYGWDGPVTGVGAPVAGPHLCSAIHGARMSWQRGQIHPWFTGHLQGR